MDQNELNKLLGGQAPHTPAADPQAAPTTPDQQQASPPADIVIPGQHVQGVWDVLSQGFNAGSQVNPEIINHANTPAEASAMKDAAVAAGMPAVTGGFKSLFETKDFLFGDTPPDQQSSFRQGIEAADAAMKEQRPIVAGLASGIGQFAVAMVGLGKVAGVAKAVVPAARTAVAAVEGLKGGKVAMESGKAAMAGAMAFDPHEERLSNLIQNTPLANPFNAWLAAQPGDSAAMGRLKNAMESLGMDAAIIGTFTGALKVWKYLKAGKTAEASRAVGDMERARNEHIAGVAQDAAPAPKQSGDLGAQTQADPMAADPVQTQGAAAGEPNGYVKVEPDAASPDAVKDPNATAAPDGAAPQAAEGRPTADPMAKVADGANPTQDVPKGDVPVTDTVANAAAAPETATAAPTGYKDTVVFTGPEAAGIVDQIGYTLENAQKAWEDLSKHGSISAMLAAGKRVSPDLGTFYDRFRTDSDVTDLIALAAHEKEAELAANGWRVRVTDKEFMQQVSDFASLTGSAPQELLGKLQAAGEAQNNMAAKMVVAGSLASKTFQDASLLAMRRKLGDFTEFGSLEAMEEEIAKRFSLATSLLKITDEIRSEAGRTLRANRGRPFDPALFEGLTKDRFYEMLASADGQPTTLKVLADPSLPRKIMDTVNYLRVASLVSGPKTQLINILSNSYMLAFRPMERLLGAGIATATGRIPGQASGQIIKENLKQYAYMGSALVDGFGMAAKAFVRNDGLLRPFGTEAVAESQRTGWTVPGTQALDANYFKPWDSLPNLIWNAMSVPMTAAGVPLRMLGGMDELVKQIVYRSKLMASAHIEGTQKAIEAGLDAPAAKAFVKSYVDKAVDSGFDSEGRGLNEAALREADIATFQQDLKEGTIGRNLQVFVSKDPSQFVRFILPFVKTPTNIIRYSWKMTPVLNLLQEEFRSAFMGHLGFEARSQAIGQMSLGSLFMGSAAYLALNGMITGGGPSDKNAKSQLLATGWQPYSFIRHNDDGSKTYVPFGRYDPVGLPFGIIADIMDAQHNLQNAASPNHDVDAAIYALCISLAKQFTSRTYLLSLTQAIDAMSDPDRNGATFMGGLAQSMVPFSSATRQLSQDDYMRDARTMADKLMQVTPGLSEKLPPKYNWLGQPVLNRQGLWTDDNGSLVDMETQRLGLEGGGATINVPSPNIDYGGGAKLDLRDITLSDGRDAYAVFQELSGKPTPRATPLVDQVAKVMRSKAYSLAPDGDRDVKGTKLWMLGSVVSKYREAAKKVLLKDPNIRQEITQQRGLVSDSFKHLREAPPQAGKGDVGGVLNAFGQGGPSSTTTMGNTPQAKPSGNKALTPSELIQQLEPSK